MLVARAIAVVVAVTLGSRGGAAHAEPVAVPPPPHLAHVVDVPTAWIAPRDQVWGSGGASAGDSGLKASTRDSALMVMVGAGLAGLAEVSVGLSDKLIACKPCGGLDRASQPAWLGIAGFRLGLPAGKLGRGQPAVALGFERSFAGWAGHDGGDAAPDERVTPRVAQLHLVTSLERGGVRVHVGATMTDAEVTDSAAHTVHLRRGLGQLRPLVGVELTTPKYPKTTLLAELTWAPELGDERITMRWAGSWGVRYQALRWGSIELAVRHRERDGLEDSTVLIRVNGVSW
jgi:hypothetical protein